MKILYIDPWLFDESSLYYYSLGLSGSLSRYADLTIYSAHEFSLPNNFSARVVNGFFPFSGKMKKGKIRLIVRGIEYICGYIKAIRISKKEKYDVIHVEWPLMERLDPIFYKALKKNCNVFSYKAHNVLPHSTGEKYVGMYKKIYAIPDVILVHGEGIRREFEHYFPSFIDKVEIQKFGINCNHKNLYDDSKVVNELKNAIEARKRVYTFFGRIDEDKGVDRLVEIWEKQMKNSDSLLVVAGKVKDYSQFLDTKYKMEKEANIFFMEGMIDDNDLNYIISKSNLILMPYRKGSMSGVIYTSVEFFKPVLTTDFGSIKEYLPSDYELLVENTDEAIASCLKHIDEDYSDSDLSEIGVRLHDYFYDNYQWKNIAQKLVNQTFNRKRNN